MYANSYAPTQVQAYTPVQNVPNYAPIGTQAYAPSQTQAHVPVQNVPSYAPTQVQAYTPVQSVPVRQPKPLSVAQIVFTIVNSEIAKYKRAGQNVDVQALRQSYQAHYTGWNYQQLMQAAFSLVEIYDHNTRQWRLIRDEQELRTKQAEFSKRYHYWNNQSATR